MNIILIEDEEPAARRLRRLIGSLRPNWKIVGQADSVLDAVELFASQPHVDLAFFDIQLADGVSFDILSQSNVKCPIIFTTAYDHYAVKAFKVNSIDYLLKPIEEKELLAALEKFEQRAQVQSGSDLTVLLDKLRGETDRYRQRFLVKTAGRLAFVIVNDIAYFFSEEGSTFLVTKNNDRYLLETTLEEMETELNPERFFRISRKMIICLECIARIEPHFSNRLLLDLLPPFGAEVVVSRQRAGEFKAWLDR